MEHALSRSARKVLDAGLIGVVACLLALAFLPAAYWLSAVGWALRVVLLVGSWPPTFNPENALLHHAPGSAWLEWAVPFAGLFLFEAVGLLVLARHFRHRHWIAAAAVVWALLWPATYALMRLDPGGILSRAID